MGILIRGITLICALTAGVSLAAPLAAEEYILEAAYHTAGSREMGSSSSNGQNALLERILARSGDVLVIEYDLHPSATAEQRAHQWWFPMRVRKLPNGTSVLLNESELAARIDPWLAHAGMTRKACGRTIFTWDAFTIHCNPAEALAMIAPFDLRVGPLAAGEFFNATGAKQPAKLNWTRRLENPTLYTALLELDSQYVMRQSARSDVIVAEISGELLTFEDALDEREKEEVHGSMIVSFGVDEMGEVVSRTEITAVVTRKADGSTETDTQFRTVRRVPVPVVPE